MDINKNETTELIHKEIAKTKKRIEEYTEATKPIAPENSIGRLTRMDAINNKSVMEAGLREAKNKLEKLEYVLTQVGTDNFGICKNCGKEIHIKRILLRPQSLYCVNCAR